MHTQILLGIIERICLLCEQEHVPESLQSPLLKIADAIDVGVSTEIVRASMLTQTSTQREITWNEVCYWQRRIVDCQPAGILYNSEALEKAHADLEMVTRIAGGQEAAASAPPVTKVFPFELRFPFPFDSQS